MVKRVYERWARGDFGVDPELLADDFVWHQRADAVEPGSHRGAGIGRAVGRIFDVYEDFRIEEYVDAGEKVFVVARSHGRSRSSGMPLELRLAFVWSVCDGKLASMEQFAERAEALRAAGLA